MNNIATGGMASSIICALFLQRFVTDAKSWLHVDIYGWTPSAKPARPEGRRMPGRASALIGRCPEQATAVNSAEFSLSFF